MSSEVRKAMTILYKVHNGLYVNLTNRCPCACTFCERQTRDHVSEVNDAPLWLEHEPSVEEVIAEFEKTDVAKKLYSVDLVSRRNGWMHCLRSQNI